MVNLSSNCFDENCIRPILDAISINCSIVNFDISDNPCYSDKLKSIIAVKLMKNFKGNLKAGFKHDSKFLNQSQL